MKAVHDALDPLPGVAEVDIDFPNRIATLKVDDKDFDSEKVLSTLTEAGYESTIRE